MIGEVDDHRNLLASSLILWSASLAGLIVLAAGPFGMRASRSAMDLFYLLLVAGHAVSAGRCYRSGRIADPSPELLFALSAVLFLFAYIYASNANMDYVQRFAAGKTYLDFGPDSRIERLNGAIRYLPLLLADAAIIVRHRVRASMALVVASAFLTSLAFPSFASVAGFGPLAFVAVVPLLVVLVRSRRAEGILYGTFYGVITTMLTSYWLGTFSLVTLQLVTVAYAIFFALFMAIVTSLIRRVPHLALPLIPFAWVAFDFLRSTGFVGYPWGMIGTTQYGFTAFIQVAELTGVWGVSLLVLLCNAALADLLLRGRRAFRFAGVVAAVVIVAVAGGALRMRAIESIADAGPRARVALVQQNSDPRKTDYRANFDVLVRLTDKVASTSPDLIVWSETAFVPNIRRWSAEDPGRYPLAALVRDLHTYLDGLGIWLLTGNDDYEIVVDSDGIEERLSYNAAVLFDGEGGRRETYRKIHLVPFTEYFPFRKSLPWAYEALSRFDVYLWEPGHERVVFEHPGFTFSTPICFEDSFPSDVRRFVREGAALIINISNDYWSLKEAEAEQHLANALFRAVENRRPVLRATASGVTGRIDPSGRLRERLPAYVEGAIVVEPTLAGLPTTLYTRFGDWLPIASLIVTFGALAGGLWRDSKRRRKANSSTGEPEAGAE